MADRTRQRASSSILFSLDRPKLSRMSTLHPILDDIEVCFLHGRRCPLRCRLASSPTCTERKAHFDVAPVSSQLESSLLGSALHEIAPRCMRLLPGARAVP